MTGPAIDYFSLNHPLRLVASRVSHHVRRQIFHLFMDIMQPNSNDLILDVGVTPDQQLPESNFFEAMYPHTSRIVATSIENAGFLTQKHPGLFFLQTETLCLPFHDHAFDIVFCSAVLEHVGDKAHQQAFVTELLRVSKQFFIVTPNRLFPVEFHTFLPLIHWLPQPAHQKLLKMMGLNFWAQTSNLNLVSSGSLAALFPSSGAVTVTCTRLLNWPSNLIAYGKSVF
ncbi:MAG: class I SAM-dependent methyltransferase [Desulfatirhabdiaceae bacterium]